MAQAPKLKPPPKFDLEPFQTAVNDAAVRVRALWLTYIALLAYLFVAVGAVTQRDLLLQNAVKLPVLNVPLPLIGFFAVAPVLFLINHFYLLLQLLGLGRRIREFNDVLARSGLGEEAQRPERRRLDTFVIVQMLGGTKEERLGLTSKLLRFIAFITLVLAPITLLLFIQLRFLPYQNQPVTWLHRIALGADLALLWAFWPSIKLGDWAPWRGTPVRAIAVAAIMFFACGVATFPGEFADGGMSAKDWTKPGDSFLPSMKAWLFGNLARGYREPGPKGLLFFARALDLADDKTLIDQDKLDKIRKRHEESKDWLERWQTERTLSLRGRNLRGANFDRSDLRNVDLFDANLQGASLTGASLQGASLTGASLQGASLDLASLQGASLAGASLQGASLMYVNLQGARLDRASLQGASLLSASLQGTWLKDARLQDASLGGASLQGASLEGASLEAASLNFANLQGTSLDSASLQGASLKGTRLQGASLYRAGLQGALLRDAKLQGASLVGAFLWRTHGLPNPGNPVRVWVHDPQLQAMTPKQLTTLEKNALTGVRDGEVKLDIKRAFARLSIPEPEKDVRDNLPDIFWTGLVGKISESDHEDNLAKRLMALACDEKGAPYVAQSLIVRESESHRDIASMGPIFAIGRSNFPGFVRALLDAAEGKTTDCPGAKGLDVDTIAHLRKWGEEIDKEQRRRRSRHNEMTGPIQGGSALPAIGGHGRHAGRPGNPI